MSWNVYRATRRRLTRPDQQGWSKKASLKFEPSPEEARRRQTPRPPRWIRNQTDSWRRLRRHIWNLQDSHSTVLQTRICGSKVGGARSRFRSRYLPSWYRLQKGTAGEERRAPAEAREALKTGGLLWGSPGRHGGRIRPASVRPSFPPTTPGSDFEFGKK